MNFLDWILIILVGAYALSGYWQGFITGAFATGGLLLGGFIGIWLAPKVLGSAAPSLWVSLGALFVVIACASIGQAVLQYGGVRVRDEITWQPARIVDALGGSLLSAAAVLVVAWALGVAVSGAQINGLTPAVRGSAILAKVDSIMPSPADRALSAFNDVVGTSFFPRYLEPFASERIVEVGPGPRRMLTDPDVERAGESVLKIRGANECGKGVEGTGFVIGRGYLMTNAHVVAGVDDPNVIVGEGANDAKVVHYDPEIDIAVLKFEGGGNLKRLEFDRTAGAEDPIAVLGYPQDGPFDVQPGRIRAEQRLRSPDIYGVGTVIRDVYSVRSLIRPGNSGGPIVDSEGDVVGVVFAASVTDSETGYALTTDQVIEIAREARSQTATVDTGACAG